MKNILIFILLASFFGCESQSITTQNGLIAAISAAKQNGGTINLNGAKIKVTSEILIDFDCKVDGGELITVDSTVTAFNVFRIKKGGSLTCSNLKITGPKYAGGVSENVPFTTAFFVDGGGASLTLNNCGIYGKFHNSVSKTSTGDTDSTKTVIWINGGEIDCFAQCVSFFTVNECTGSYFYADGVRFLRSGVSKENNNGNAYGHTIYMHPSVKANITGCEFGKSERNSISYFSGSAITSDAGRLKVTNCTFLSQSQGIYLATRGIAEISDCTFFGRECVRIGGGDFSIKDNMFLCDATTAIVSTVGIIRSAKITGNFVKPHAIPSTFGYAMFALISDGNYDISENRVFGTLYNGSIIFNLSSESAVYRVRDNSFFCNPTYAINGNKGKYSIKDNLYIGPTVNANFSPLSIKYVDDGN